MGGECPETTAEVLRIAFFFFLGIVIMVLGFLFRIPIVSVLGGLGFAFMWLYLATCLGAIVYVFALGSVLIPFGILMSQFGNSN